MGIISEINNSVDLAKKLLVAGKPKHKWTVILRATASVILAFVIFLHYWNVLAYIPIGWPPMFPEKFAEFLESKTSLILLIWFICSQGFSVKILNRILAADRKCQQTLMPIIFTIEVVLEWISSVVYILCSLHELLKCAHGIMLVELENRSIYLIAVVYLLSNALKYIYDSQYELWSRMELEQSDFYDVQEKRIYEHDIVLYCNTLYIVCCSCRAAELQPGQKQVWTLTAYSYRNSEEIPLVDAIRNKEGKIKILQRPWEK